MEILTYAQAVGKRLRGGGERMFGYGDEEFIAYDNGEEVGSISYYSRLQDAHVGNYGVFQITDLEVKENRRREGIGTLLLTKLLDNYGANTVALFAEIDGPAYPLYERFGFKNIVTGMNPEDFGVSEEIAQKIAYMERPAQKERGKIVESQREYDRACLKRLTDSWKSRGLLKGD